MNLKYELGLPNSLTGKSFADASKSVDKMFKDRMSNIDIRTKKTFLSRLKDAQEVQRKELEDSELQQSQMMYGGPDGEDPIVTNTDPNSIDNNMLQNLNNMASPVGKDSWLKNTFGKNGSVPEWLTKNENQNANSVLGGIGVAASVLGPMISNRRAMKSLQQPVTSKAMLMDQNQIQPNFVNRQQLMRNLTEQANTQRYNMSQTGGNWGQYSQGLSGLNASMLGTSGNLMLQSDLADSAEKIRVQQGRQGVQQFNIGQTQRAEELNAQNSAAYSNQIAAYKQAQGANIGNIGQSLFNLMQAKQYGKSMGQAGMFKAMGD